MQELLQLLTELHYIVLAVALEEPHQKDLSVAD